jgi:hypothetical protein
VLPFSSIALLSEAKSRTREQRPRPSKPPRRVLSDCPFDFPPEAVESDVRCVPAWLIWSVNSSLLTATDSRALVRRVWWQPSFSFRSTRVDVPRQGADSTGAREKPMNRRCDQPARMITGLFGDCDRLHRRCRINRLSRIAQPTGACTQGDITWNTLVVPGGKAGWPCVSRRTPGCGRRSHRSIRDVRAEHGLARTRIVWD